MRSNAAKALAKEVGNGSVAIAADMSSADGWKGAAEAALKALGEVDILVNNAGVSEAQALGAVTGEGLDATLNVNVRNLILLTDALSASLIRRRGCVVNISSVSAYSGAMGQIAYSTSKGAVNSFTRNASIDFGRRAVTIVGSMFTPGTSAVMSVRIGGMWPMTGTPRRARISAGDRKLLSDTGRHVSPPSVVFHTPPPVAPK